jgi:hypothetical protein
MEKSENKASWRMFAAGRGKFLSFEIFAGQV